MSGNLLQPLLQLPLQPGLLLRTLNLPSSQRLQNRLPNASCTRWILTCDQESSIRECRNHNLLAVVRRGFLVFARAGFVELGFQWEGHILRESHVILLGVGETGYGKGVNEGEGGGGVGDVEEGGGAVADSGDGFVEGVEFED
ncbi:hypothetical protein ACMFMG_012193 [Clarireedia jacksonii]